MIEGAYTNIQPATEKNSFLSETLILTPGFCQGCRFSVSLYITANELPIETSFFAYADTRIKGTLFRHHLLKTRLFPTTHKLILGLYETASTITDKVFDTSSSFIAN